MLKTSPKAPGPVTLLDVIGPGDRKRGNNRTLRLLALTVIMVINQSCCINVTGESKDEIQKENVPFRFKEIFPKQGWVKEGQFQTAADARWYQDVTYGLLQPTNGMAIEDANCSR